MFVYAATLRKNLRSVVGTTNNLYKWNRENPLDVLCLASSDCKTSSATTHDIACWRFRIAVNI